MLRLVVIEADGGGSVHVQMAVLWPAVIRADGGGGMWWARADGEGGLRWPKLMVVAMFLHVGGGPPMSVLG
jgi:hypothetical protein